MYHVLHNTHWQDSQEHNILRTVVTFQNTSNFDHYLSSHDFHKLGQIQTLKQSRVVYGFKETFIMLNKAFLQYSSSQATDCFSKKKKKKGKGDTILC